MNRELLIVDKDGVLIQVVQGDITQENVDAIVNPANSSLKHGGGIAGAIIRKGGRIIQEESDRIGFLPTGKAVYTGAGNLKAKYVIHTVGPVWGEGDEERKLRSAVSSVFDVARKISVKSISIPAISTGIFGYPKKEGVYVIVDQVLKEIEKDASYLEKVRLIAIDDETVALFKDEISAKFGLK
ncbi:macro domain-containing protein [Desulfurobacterium atlanticum]|uniref:O-acetyl-ADP-ribose deacetylase (Regulator of RNase III), contains Macro domain n=1 Tax=Desulfurobacterium atlanticum TaxID=240169 RepID=A0A238XJ24_9BACT|nr:macro domain-containing protein [Desulfurobacterium atlanticum]SNR58692.1 O-acetyl-ADP-ribose deacetylase (regulator of RNase III), contains Macro domain [Desulfurobacterium atlanticum]